MRAITATTLCQLLLAACGPNTGRSETVVLDSSGVEILTYQGPDQPLNWSLERMSTLGGADSGAQAFFFVEPRLLAGDQLGRVYVLNSADAEIVEIDSTGTTIGTVGRAGEGPGELTRPASLSVQPNGAMAVFDYSRMGLVGFDPNANPTPTIPFPYPPSSFTQPHFAPWGEGWVVSTTSPLPDGGTELQLRTAASRDTLVFARIDQPPMEMAIYESCGGGLKQPPVFANQMVWAASTQTIAVANTPGYRVDLITSDGRRMSIRRDLEPVRASRALAEQELGEGFRMNFGRGVCIIPPSEMVEKRGVADVIPLIDYLAIGPDDELWVQRHAVSAGEIGPIDVFDHTGEYVGTLTGFPMPAVFLSKDLIGAIDRSETETQLLRLGRIVR